ncbi:MAG TPA: nucleoside monophosphate kinase [Candidatus Paceibacterota bacterium]|nr:nucleoside monophosphate kinase [Candidatus Paceibacterota bacterium]
METRTIFFVGKPGCGKGTQAKLLAEKTGWPMFSSGNLFRELEKENTPVGHKLREENQKGFLSPHWFAMYLYLKTLFSVPGTSSVIFDGFNRKVPEAELIVDSLKWLGRPFQIINIKVSDETMQARLAKRHETSGRADDAPEIFPERLAEYKKFTEPAIELFRREGVLIEIDGEKTPEEIAQSIRRALNLK